MDKLFELERKVTELQQQIGLIRVPKSFAKREEDKVGPDWYRKYHFSEYGVTRRADKSRVIEIVKQKNLYGAAGAYAFFMFRREHFDSSYDFGPVVPHLFELSRFFNFVSAMYSSRADLVAALLGNKASEKRKNVLRKKYADILAETITVGNKYLKVSRRKAKK